MGGTLSLSQGDTSSSVGGSRRLWAGSLFMGAGLLIVAGGARSCAVLYPPWDNP